MAYSSDKVQAEEGKLYRLNRKGVLGHSRRPHDDSLWMRVRVHFETGADRPNFAQLAKLYGLGMSTISKRAKIENWNKQGTLAITTQRAMVQEATRVVKEAASEMGVTLKKQINDGLQQFIEREKTRHIKSQVKRAKVALTRLDLLTAPIHEGESPLEAKDESFIAKSIDTYDNIVRRNLGMESGVGGTGANLSLNILTNHAAVQVTHDKP